MAETALDYAKKATELCVLPDVYLRLKEVLDDETSTFEDIAQIILLSPVLSSTLLKIANSALFNFPREIDSISKSLSILGLQQVRSLVNTYGLTKAFAGIDPNVIDLDKFWEISVDSALIAKFLAKKNKVKNTESIFLSGLLHNVGELAMLATAPKKVQYCESYDKEQTPWQRQEDVFGFTFSDCTAELLNLWDIPESIIKPIREHNLAFQQDLDDISTILYIAIRAAVLNSHPGLYSKKTFIAPHILKDHSYSLADVNEAIDYCNAEGLAIMSVLKLKNTA